jgi:hypothetical protein
MKILGAPLALVTCGIVGGVRAHAVGEAHVEGARHSIIAIARGEAVYTAQGAAELAGGTE